MGQAVLHEGWVRRHSGEQVAGAVVAVQRGTAPTPEIAIRCDTEGRFRIALPPGHYDIQACTPNGVCATVNIETGTVKQIIEIAIG